VGRSSNLRVGQELAERAVTLLKNDNNLPAVLNYATQSRIVSWHPMRNTSNPWMQTLQEMVKARAITGVI
jgi:3-dehydroquinate dehydratase